MIISTEEQIKSLKNVKLVVGNGFDLHCGLRTSYKHYFWFYRRLYEPIIKWYSSINESFQKGENISKSKLNIPFIDSLNVWDYFFAITYVEKNAAFSKWCDVENLIFFSLVTLKEKEDIQDKQEAQFILKARHISPVNWRESFKLFYLDKNVFDCNGVMSAVLKKFINSTENFYRFLLEELIKFEERFGSFITAQIEKDITPGWPSTHIFNSKYKECINQTIENLCGEESIESIDSFNYSYFCDDDNLNNKIHHINGNSQFPIFGIDSASSINDDVFIFTKTNRRIELEIDTSLIDVINFDFDNLFIYGHSFNEADYNYFFPVFDKMRLLDGSHDSKVVVCYSEEQDNKEIEQLKKSFYRMIIEYSKYFNADATRSLDSLSTSGRIIFYEVPKIKQNSITMNYTHFDSPWDGFEEL